MPKRLLTLLPLLIFSVCCIRHGGEPLPRELHILSTNDVHGAWSDSVCDGSVRSACLYAISTCVDSIRAAVGEDNVLLIDAGDCLQGDNAAYYFNYVDTIAPHLFPRIAAFMHYDAVTVGNHDIETGHSVYDRVAADLSRAGIPFLGGNVVRLSDGKPYFPTCKLFRKAGMKVLVLGYTNANIKAWLNESLWSGLDFKSLLPIVQDDVDRLSSRFHPHAVVVSVHSGTGSGDGTILESQGLDLLQSLRGVDFLICSHDHRPLIVQNDSICLMNSGSRAQYLSHGVLTVNGGRRLRTAELIKTDRFVPSERMRAEFAADMEAVREFSLRKVGHMSDDMYTRDSYLGMCDYMNLIHTVCLSCTGADISFAAPLTYDGVIPSGPLVYNDLFKIYPYENQLFVVKMTGEEVRRYLEYSYDGWINTVSSPWDHVLKIHQGGDPRTGSRSRWSFDNRSYNFDSAAGLNYTVDVTRPSGSRVRISSLAGGTPFCQDSTYNVAMTSYRASGGGAIMTMGAGIDTSVIEERVVGKYPEMRNLIYDYLQKNGIISSFAISNPSLLGHWSFVPADIAVPALASDFELLF